MNRHARGGRGALTRSTASVSPARRRSACSRATSSRTRTVRHVVVSADAEALKRSVSALPRPEEQALVSDPMRPERLADVPAVGVGQADVDISAAGASGSVRARQLGSRRDAGVCEALSRRPRRRTPRSARRPRRSGPRHRWGVSRSGRWHGFIFRSSSAYRSCGAFVTPVLAIVFGLVSVSLVVAGCGRAKRSAGSTGSSTGAPSATTTAAPAPSSPAAPGALQGEALRRDR